MRKSKDFWDNHAEGYAKRKISDEATYQRKLAETQRYLSPEMHILEFGCGTGMTAIQHAPHVQHIDALDTSAKMLDIARANANTTKVENITFTQSTLIDFNAIPASVDAVLGLNVIHLLSNRHATLKEVATILKPNGVFVSSTACIGHSYLRFIKLLRPIGKYFGLLPDFSVLTEEKWIEEINNAGFSIETHWHHGMKDISVFVIARKIS